MKYDICLLIDSASVHMKTYTRNMRTVLRVWILGLSLRLQTELEPLRLAAENLHFEPALWCGFDI